LRHLIGPLRRNADVARRGKPWVKGDSFRTWVGYRVIEGGSKKKKRSLSWERGGGKVCEEKKTELQQKKHQDTSRGTRGIGKHHGGKRVGWLMGLKKRGAAKRPNWSNSWGHNMSIQQKRHRKLGRRNRELPERGGKRGQSSATTKSTGHPRGGGGKLANTPGITRKKQGHCAEQTMSPVYGKGRKVGPVEKIGDCGKKKKKQRELVLL